MNTLEREEQQDNEQITGDIFKSFHQDPTLTERLPYTKKIPTERYVYKLRPNYSHTQKITLHQIQILNDEHDTITSQQNFS